MSRSKLRILVNDDDGEEEIVVKKDLPASAVETPPSHFVIDVLGEPVVFTFEVVDEEQDAERS